MQNKTYCILLSLLISFLFPIEAGNKPSDFKVAWYYPTSKNFRDIYSDAILYSLETNIQIWGNFTPWLSVGYLCTSGNSIGKSDDTDLYAIPIGVGLKYFFNLCGSFQPYLGIGPVVTYSHINNDSSFVSPTQTGWGIGGIAKSGFLTDLSDCIFLDVFLDYTYLKMNFSHSSKKVIKRNGDLSGLSVGAGIGYRF